jgi:hypothetical protein
MGESDGAFAHIALPGRVFVSHAASAVGVWIGVRRIVVPAAPSQDGLL